jgi:SAM-dependent methyltransferase
VRSSSRSRAGRRARRWSLPPAIARTLELVDPVARSAHPRVEGGVLDLLGDRDPTGARAGQGLMVTGALPRVYERLWRPIGNRLFMGVRGPGMAGERRLAEELLEPAPGDRILDVASGPGNFTRAFARSVCEEGLVVGLDASRTMLARAVREGVPPNVAYALGDASALPFGDEAFDAVCCFAALYLIEDPFRAITEIARVLGPGGRVALLASVNRGLLPASATNALVRPLTGVRIFGRDDLTGALRRLGLVDVRRRVHGLGQFVGARKPPGGCAP